MNPRQTSAASSEETMIGSQMVRRATTLSRSPFGTGMTNSEAPQPKRITAKPAVARMLPPSPLKSATAGGPSSNAAASNPYTPMTKLAHRGRFGVAGSGSLMG